jgi:hypothetical protein
VKKDGIEEVAEMVAQSRPGEVAEMVCNLEHVILGMKEERIMAVFHHLK